MSSIDDKNLRKKVFRKINKINKKELYFQVYQIIIDNNETHTTNSNGVFFDLYTISLQSVNEIDKILENDISTETETDNMFFSDENKLSENIISDLDKAITVDNTISMDNII